MSPRIVPNLLLVGAPKCGTTALASYLREHPAVFMSTPKEPHYFCDDFANYYAPGRRSQEHYLGLFAGADERHRAVGEASVWYLYSARAIPRIRRFNPTARIVAMVRNPIELVASLHAQLLYNLDEDEPDLAAAWRLQGSRRAGRRLPALGREPAFLQYGQAALLGAQLARVYQTFPRSQVHVVLQEQMRADPAGAYREVLRFLDLPDDGRRAFPPLNSRRVHRVPALARLTQRPAPALVAAAGLVRRATGVERLRVLERVRARNAALVAPAPIAPDLVAEMAEYFRADVALLGELIGRDLSGWLASRGPAPGGGQPGAESRSQPSRLARGPWAAR